MQNDGYFDGKDLTVVGWGVTEYGGVPSTILKKAKLRVVNNPTCAMKNKFVTKSQICTNESKSGSSCTRDSGGGLYWTAGRQYAIALVSYGTFCASTVPSVNTRITSHISWIESNVDGFLCRKK